VPVEVDFLKEPANTIRYNFAGHITHADLEAASEAEIAIFDSLPDHARLYIIVEMSDLHTISPNLFPRLQALRLVHDPRILYVFVVGANAYLRALALSLGLFNSPHEFVFCATLDEALKAMEAQA